MTDVVFTNQILTKTNQERLWGIHHSCIQARRIQETKRDTYKDRELIVIYRTGTSYCSKYSSNILKFFLRRHEKKTGEIVSKSKVNLLHGHIFQCCNFRSSILLSCWISLEKKKTRIWFQNDRLRSTPYIYTIYINQNSMTIITWPTRAIACEWKNISS